MSDDGKTVGRWEACDPCDVESEKTAPGTLQTSRDRQRMTASGTEAEAS